MIETGQFTLHATFLAQPNQYDAMKALTRDSFALTQATPGLQQVICLEPPKETLPFVFISVWQSKADFQAFLQTPAMREFHSKDAVEAMFATAIADSSAEFYTVMDAWHAPH